MLLQFLSKQLTTLRGSLGCRFLSSSLVLDALSDLFFIGVWVFGHQHQPLMLLLVVQRAVAIERRAVGRRRSGRCW
jgi:hypothetical protein